MMYRVYNVALSGKTHIEGIWSQGWAVVSRCTTIAVVNNLLLEWKSPLNSFGLDPYERCYQSDYEWKDNTFRLASIKYPLRNLVERSAAIRITRLLFYYRSIRSKYRFERCAFSLRTLQMAIKYQLNWVLLALKHKSSIINSYVSTNYHSYDLNVFLLVDFLLNFLWIQTSVCFRAPPAAPPPRGKRDDVIQHISERENGKLDGKIA